MANSGDADEHRRRRKRGRVGNLDPSDRNGSPAVKRGNGKYVEGASVADSVQEREIIKCKGSSKEIGHAQKKKSVCKEDFGYYNGAKDVIYSDENLDKLNVVQCKDYLRWHSLRLTGSKAILIQRIQEHIELKDGRAMSKYPKSTFTIDCTGDVCTGDLVIFKQRVYIRWRGRPSRFIGHRVVAGRVIKESYGIRKQQHTFTIEVLWSKGEKELPPMHSLIIKGRNLYRYRTFRQPSELDRIRVLEEKHARGELARDARLERLSGKKLNWKSRAKVKRPSGCRKEECVLDISAGSAGALIGKQGENVRAISKASGAKIRVRGHESSSALRAVKLVGTAKQIRSATKLVRQAIGSSPTKAR